MAQSALNFLNVLRSFIQDLYISLSLYPQLFESVLRQTHILTEPLASGQISQGPSIQSTFSVKRFNKWTYLDDIFFRRSQNRFVIMKCKGQASLLCTIQGHYPCRLPQEHPQVRQLRPLLKAALICTPI